MVIVNLEKRHLFLLVAIGIFLVGVGIVVSVDPGGAGNPGHNINSIGAPDECSTNQVLKWDGSAWDCVDLETQIQTIENTVSVLENNMVTVTETTKGSVVGGGYQYLATCSAWSGAVCSSGNLVCPTGSTKRLSGKYSPLAAPSTEYEYYLCIQN